MASPTGANLPPALPRPDRQSGFPPEAADALEDSQPDERFLEDRQFIEVETPSCRGRRRAAAGPSSPTTTPWLDFFLRISLELYLKRLLVAAGPRIRDRPQLPQRGNLPPPQPGVTMLEVYQAYSDHRA